MTEKDLPKAGSIVLATVQHWYTGGTRTVMLKRVDEDDCWWRTVDDNSELSYDWNVISWRAIPSASEVRIQGQA